MNTRLLTSEIRNEHDVVFVRQRARDLARLLGFERQDQTRIATAVSEIARNAYEYARGGHVDFSIQYGIARQLVIQIRDEGSGICNLDEIMEGRYCSTTGLGMGLIGTKRLMDEFRVETSSGGGTRIRLGKVIPSDLPPLTPQRIFAITDELSRTGGRAPLGELQEQNRELMRAMDELREKQQELVQLNRELEDTNRGVVALYGELDEKADALKIANATKTRFLSNITHEFRTPLGGAVNLAEMLLDGLEGPLNENQAKTVRLIKKANEGLLEMVHDLLDLAKVEAGRIPVRPVNFDIRDLFASLRGLMNLFAEKTPLVRLEFCDLIEPFEIFSDEGKISQILRNLISNAIKYTEAGFVRVEARKLDSSMFKVSVKDTGIGIDAQDLSRIFEEFTQIDSHLQKKHKGTGIGLSLTRKLVQLLGGDIQVESTAGKGSTFTVTLPFKYLGGDEGQYVATGGAPLVLLIDDEEIERHFLRSLLVSKYECEVIECSDGNLGVELVRLRRPAVVLLDLNMNGTDGFAVLKLLKDQGLLSTSCVVVHSGKVLTEEDHVLLRDAQAILSKTQDSEEDLIVKVAQIMMRCGIRARV